MEYAGSADTMPDGNHSSRGQANFLVGSRNRWRTGLPMFQSIRYEELYPGVDALFAGEGRLLKSEFHIAAGAEPSQIRIQYRGGERVSIEPDGSLRIDTISGILREAPPVAYQEAGGIRQVVRSAYRLNADGTVGFVVGNYRRDRMLVVDPVFAYSTFLGGGKTDIAYDVAVDTTGAAYITGMTDSTDLQTTSSAFQRLYPGGVNAFVAKVNPSGTALVYFTYLGGTIHDEAQSIAVDASGSAYITGWTTSPDFPVSGAIQSVIGSGARDAFVVKLNPAGSAIIWSTFLGGADDDWSNSVALDGAGSTYVTGYTRSTNFPTASPYQAALASAQDGFVAKINSAGSALVFSTYLGGNGEDRPASIAVDATGASYVAGRTNSTNFPIAGPIQATLGGSYDLFVTKLNPSGSSLVYSTYLGGSRPEQAVYGRCVAVDSAGAAYVVATTMSIDFPVVNAIRASNRSILGTITVSKLAPNGASLVYSSYLGGSVSDSGYAVAIDAAQRVYLTGSASSVNFPIVNSDSTQFSGFNDVFVMRLNPSGTAVERSELIGAVDGEAAYGIALDSSGGVYLTGATSSVAFPLMNPIQSSSGGNVAAFLLKLANAGAPNSVSASPSSGSGSSATLVLTYSDPDGFNDITTASALVHTSTSTASACYVRYTRATNLLELSNDSGTGWVGSKAPGSAGTLENSQCVLNAASSAAAGTGPNLTVSLAFTFRGSFAGAKNVYLDVSDSGGTSIGWQSHGTWTVTAGGTVPNNLVSVTPSSGSGAQQSFQFAYSSVYGFQDVKWAFLNISPSGGTANACMARYVQAANQVELSTNDASDWVARGSPGSQVLLENSQCRINLALSSAVGTGSTLTLTLSITFKSGYTGGKGVYMAAFSDTSILTNWTSMGTFNVLFNYPPVPVSVTPANGSGAAQVFEFAYSDQNGFADIVWSAMLIHAALTPLNSCLIRFTRATNLLELANDAGAFTNSLTMGFAGTIQNSQCSLDGGASAAILAGNNLSVRVAVSFKPGYTGAKSMFSTAGDVPGNVATWMAQGNWSVP